MKHLPHCIGTAVIAFSLAVAGCDAQDPEVAPRVDEGVDLEAERVDRGADEAVEPLDPTSDLIIDPVGEPIVEGYEEEPQREVVPPPEE